MICELTYIRYTRGGAYCRVRYRSNRAVTIMLPTDHMPAMKYGSCYEFDETAAAVVKQAIDQHEAELVEARRLG
ncbi:hypothetical protein LLG95_12980 [bacterium]|nr:hypothetical protein [bacterium]